MTLRSKFNRGNRFYEYDVILRFEEENMMLSNSGCKYCKSRW